MCFVLRTKTLQHSGVLLCLICLNRTQVILDVDQQTPYPIDVLPHELQKLILEIEHYYKAPVAMIATCALSILAASAQALADIDIDGTLKKPLSLFTLIVAESGERKSEVDKVLSKPLHEWERQQLEDKADEISAARAAKKSWDAQIAGIERGIQTLASKNKDTSDMEKKLKDLESSPPVTVRVPDIVMQDQTPEGMAKAIKHYPSICLLSSEAAVVLGGHGMGKDSASRNQGMMNDLWSGQPIKITRATAESFRLYQRRLSAGLAVQPSVLAAFSKDGQARGIGFFARFLMTYPESTKGTRFYDPPSDWNCLNDWCDRIHELLNLPLNIDADGGLQPELLRLDSDAKQLWIDGYNEIERELGRFGQFTEVADIASKSADNAARIAGLLHIYQHGVTGCVSADAMYAGLTLALWYLQESKRYFTQSKLDEKLTRADQFEQWLVRLCLAQKNDAIGRSYVMQHSPIRALRNAAAIDEVIKILGPTRCRQVTANGKKTILINPKILRSVSGANDANCANP